MVRNRAARPSRKPELDVVEAAGVEPEQGIENTQVTDFKKG
jgi:hypothetical protein